MDKLSTSILTQIYGYLTLGDMMRASRVCRRWSLPLWRDEEQVAVWHRRLFSVLSVEKRPRASCTLNVLKECFLKRELPYKLPEEIAHWTKVILPAKRLKQLETLSLSLCMLPHARKKILCGGFGGSRIYSSVREREFGSLVGYEEDQDAHFYVPAFSTDEICALYRYEDGAVMCLQGLFDGQKRLLDGALIKNGELLYNGEFAGGRPNGQGILYFQGVPHIQGTFADGVPHGFARFYGADGKLRFEGEWEHGRQHGQGTEYYEGSAEKKFEGTYAGGEQHRGMWFNSDGSLIHFGQQSWFAESIGECTAEHRCSYTITKNCHAKQMWMHCETCFGDDKNLGVCMACAGNCHKGHKLVNQQSGPFFCDCGAGSAPSSCRAMAGCSEECECEIHLPQDEEDPPELPQRDENEQDEEPAQRPQSPQLDEEQEEIEEENQNENQNEQENEVNDAAEAAEALHGVMVGRLPPDVFANPRARLLIELWGNGFKVLGARMANDDNANDENDENDENGENE